MAQEISTIILVTEPRSLIHSCEIHRTLKTETLAAQSDLKQ